MVVKRKYFKSRLNDTKNAKNPDGTYEPNPKEPTTEAEANLVSSLADDGLNEQRLNYDRRHYPVLDLDFPCELVPSSTPGKFHLYMDKEVTWLLYQPVLTAMAAAGILEPGYVGASIAAGATFVRKKGIKKDV